MKYLSRFDFLLQSLFFISTLGFLFTYALGQNGFIPTAGLSGLLPISFVTTFIFTPLWQLTVALIYLFTKPAFRHPLRKHYLMIATTYAALGILASAYQVWDISAILGYVYMSIAVGIALFNYTLSYFEFRAVKNQ